MSEFIEIRRALLSCWNKDGLLPLARALAEKGVELISSGGTARFLRENGLQVIEVSRLTQFPEMLDGRVKTLHPVIHGAILARRTPEHLQQLRQAGIQPIDLVVVNLYPFLEASRRAGKSEEEMVELIDIGGPAMLRAAAKNHRHVVPLHHPGQYGQFLDIWQSHHFRFPVTESRKLAAQAFYFTAYYDARISGFLQDDEKQSLPGQISLFYRRSHSLRYGENPHQPAALYVPFSQEQEKDVAGLQQLQGKEMSFNNYVDVAAAAMLAEEFQEPFAAIIKHTNPCGAASAGTLQEAFQKALATDPISAFGGIIAVNQPLDGPTAEKISSSFYECVVAPDYTSDALDQLRKKKNLRVLRKTESWKDKNQLDVKFLPVGMLVQLPDREVLPEQQVESVGDREPTESEWQDLRWAWKIVKHVKSNAIVLVRNRQLLGVGAGQMSRVDAVRLAVEKAHQAGHSLQGAVLASDAFFPFPDGVEVAAEAGVTAVIQPGGSIRDDQVIQSARQKNLAMILTHIRHFKH